MHGRSTVEPFMASMKDTLPVDTSSAPTLHTPEIKAEGHQPGLETTCRLVSMHCEQRELFCFNIVSCFAAMCRGYGKALLFLQAI